MFQTILKGWLMIETLTFIGVIVVPALAGMKLCGWALSKQKPRVIKEYEEMDSVERLIREIERTKRRVFINPARAAHNKFQWRIDRDWLDMKLDEAEKLLKQGELPDRQRDRLLDAVMLPDRNYE